MRQIKTRSRIIRETGQGVWKRRMDLKEGARHVSVAPQVGSIKRRENLRRRCEYVQQLPAGGNSSQGVLVHKAEALLYQQRYTLTMQSSPLSWRSVRVLDRSLISIFTLLFLLLLLPLCGAATSAGQNDRVQNSAITTSRQRFPAPTRSNPSSIPRSNTAPALIIAQHVGTLGAESMNGSLVPLPGAVARLPFDLQPVIKIPQEGRESA